MDATSCVPLGQKVRVVTVGLTESLWTRQVTVSNDWEPELRKAETWVLPGPRLGGECPTPWGPLGYSY